MYVAAFRGKLDVCKWLYGAAADVCKGNTIQTHTGPRTGYTPLCAATARECESKRKSVTRWLILHGAISRDASGNINESQMRKDLLPVFDEYEDAYEERPQLLLWAEEAVRDHYCFQVFLSGTLSPPEFSSSSLHKLMASRLQSGTAAQLFVEKTSTEEQLIVWEEIHAKRRSSLQCLGGYSGTLQLIADYVGIVRGRHLRILRQFAPALRQFLIDE